MLNYSYFKAAKLSAEKSEAEEMVDDILEVRHWQNVGISLNYRQVLNQIKCSPTLLVNTKLCMVE